MKASRWWLMRVTIPVVGVVLVGVLCVLGSGYIGPLGERREGTTPARNAGTNEFAYVVAKVFDSSPAPARRTPSSRIEIGTELSSLTDEQRAHIGPMLGALENIADTARAEGDDVLLAQVATEQQRIVRAVKGLQK